MLAYCTERPSQEKTEQRSAIKERHIKSTLVVNRYIEKTKGEINMTQHNRRTFLHQLGLGTLGLLAADQVSAALAQAPKIKAGQIGTRHAHASGKVGTMRKFTDLYDVVGVVEPDLDRRKELENTSAYKGVKWMTEEELLNTSGLQLVCVETAVKDLLDAAERCIDAGLHIHLDKPAGEDFKQFTRIVNKAKKQELIIQMGYMFRYNPGFRVLFKAASEGWLGNIHEAHGVISKTVGQSTRNTLAEYKGGTMFELGCHLIDSLTVFMGAPDKVTPYVRHTYPDRDNLADNIIGMFEYPRATATIRSSLMEVEGFRRRQMVAVGENGTITIRPLEAPIVEVTMAKDTGDFKKGSHLIEVPKLGGRYDGDFLELAEVLHGKREFPFSYQHDLTVQKAILDASGY